MKIPALITALLTLTGCIAQRDPAVAKERELTRRYAVCLKQQLGPFAAFASPESRRKASESCQKLIQPATPAASGEAAP